MKTFYINGNNMEACTDKDLNNAIGYGHPNGDIVSLDDINDILFEFGEYIVMFVDDEEQ